MLVPCLDEAATIGDVVAGFQASLPGCVVHVYDHGPIDDTARLAFDARPTLQTEPVPGKARLVRRLLTEVDPDVHVRADGDRTDDPS